MCLLGCFSGTDVDEQTPKIPVFVLYNRNPIYFILKYGYEILSHPDYDVKKKTVIFIHGFMDDPESSCGANIAAAYQQRNDHNFLAVDWQGQAVPDYFKNAIPAMKRVGHAVALALMVMIDHGLDVRRLHLLGHSLGAQMAGLIGRLIKRATSNRHIIQRITALDPAYPGFYSAGQEHISKHDAKFVDIIHTDGGFFGAKESTGTVDFWPNSGWAPQPGCRNMPFTVHACSHSRAWGYWIESMTNSNTEKFYAVKANSWMEFVRGETEDNSSQCCMGIDCPTHLTGNYFLLTNAEEPFARGKSGCHFKEGDPLPVQDSFVVVEPTEMDFNFSQGTEMLMYVNYTREHANRLN